MTRAARVSIVSTTAIWLSFGALACSKGDDREIRSVPVAQQRDEILRSAAQLARAYKAGNGTSACYADPIPTGEPAVVLAVTADQCLSCRSVGRLARALLERKALIGHVALVTPARDTADVCSFLQTERVAMPVAGLARHLFPDTTLTSDIFVFGVRSDGTSWNVRHARDVIDLLPTLREFRTNNQ